MPARSLIRYVTAQSQITGNGIFIFEQPPTPRFTTATGVGVGIAIAAEWGPTTAWDFTNPTAALDRYWPLGPDAAYWAIAGLPWLKPLRLIRVVGSGATAATKTFNDVDPKASLIATAAYSGTAGNNIYITGTANGSDADARDIRVRVVNGTQVMHDETYLAVQAANGAVTDPGDPYVTFTADGSADDSCAVFAETALTGGTSGTISAANVRTALDALGGVNVQTSVVAIAGFADGIADDVNEQMDQWAAAATGNGRVACLMTPSDDTAANAITAVADYRNERCRQDYPRLTRSLVYNYNGYAADGEQTTCASLVRACAYQYVDQHQAICLGGFPLPVSASVTGVADTGLDLDDLAALNAAGINTWVQVENGWAPYNDVSTYLVGGLPVAGNRIRYADWVLDAFARFQQQYLGLKLDLTLSPDTLGVNTGRQIAQMSSFLDDQQAQDIIQAGENTDGTSSPAYALDAFTLMTPTKLAAGRWDLQVSIRMTPTFLQGVIYPNIAFDLNIR